MKTSRCTVDFHLRQKHCLLLWLQGCNFNTHKGQVSAERVVEGIKDGCLMVACDTANKHTQSNSDVTLHCTCRGKLVLHLSAVQSIDRQIGYNHEDALTMWLPVSFQVTSSGPPVLVTGHSAHPLWQHPRSGAQAATLLPELRGNHAQCSRGGQDWHSRVPASVQRPTLELHHGQWQSGHFWASVR